MRRFVLMIAVAAATLPLLAHSALAQINGLRVEEDGGEIASVFGGSVTGEIAVEHEQTSGVLSVTFLNNDTSDYVPAAGDSLTWSIADTGIATSQAVGAPSPFTLSVNGVTEGMTTITFTLRNNGVLYTSPAIELHVEEEFEADGLVITDEHGTEIVNVWQGLVTGEIEVEHEQASDSLFVEFLSPDSTKFIPEFAEGFEMRLSVDDELVATVDSLGHFIFRANGIEEGMTELTISVWHIDHIDFSAPPVEIHVEEPFEADGLVISHQGQEIVTVWQGLVTGSIQVPNGGLTGDLTIEFLAPAASPDAASRFVPSAAELFEMQLSGVNGAIATVDSVGHFVMRANGVSLGSTSVVIEVFHIEHTDFTSQPIPIEVLDPSATDAGLVSVLPTSVELSRAAPNPVRVGTTIRFALPREMPVDVGVFDVTGRRIATLQSGVVEAGVHALNWQPTAVPSGVYFVRLATPEALETRKVVVAR